MGNSPAPVNAERMAPHSIEAEEAVLGSILINPDVLFGVMHFLKPDDFFIVRNGWVFEAMLRLSERRDPLDYLTVVAELATQGRLAEIGGAAYVTHLVNQTPSGIYAEGYARIVERAAIRRRLLNSASEIAALAHREDSDIDAVVAQAHASLMAVTSQYRRDELASMPRLTSELFDEVELARSRAQIGIPTGFYELDNILGGLQKSDFVLVAGRPGMGKTALLLSMALNAVRAGPVHVALFSLEMSRLQIVQRLIASETGISTDKQRRGVSDEEFHLFTEGMDRISELPIWIDDSGALTPLQLQAKAVRLHNEHRVDLIMVDYLQLMTAPTARGENRTQEVSVISRCLKQLARELNVPLVAAAQLSRAVEARNDKRPTLSDLRESGSLEQDADIVLFLYRDDYYNAETAKVNQTDVIISKHRNGPTGTVPLYFEGKITKFGNLRRPGGLS